jgi:D-alanyl-D-alanine carboxypeptidase/D-alanyl-D-alanine-endopeptidase (penicillin-binding protein 4)
VAVLCVVAAIPAAMLGTLVWWAHGQAGSGTVYTDAPASTVPLPAVLPTPLLSVRRAPSALAVDAQVALLATAAQPLLEGVDASSCAAMSVEDLSVAAVNPDLAVIPASTLKLVVAAVALDVLGSGSTFTTQVLGAAGVNGVVQGDVYLVGGGDPVLSEAWYTVASDTRKRPPMHATNVEALADALVNAGITRITGQLVGDGSRYDGEAYPPGWGDDLKKVADGVPVGALVVNDSISPEGVINSDPTLAATRTFERILLTKGVTVEGGSSTGIAPSGLGVLASVQSAMLTDIVNEMLATSDNLTAEMLVKEIAHAAGGVQGTRPAGLQALTAKLTEWGIDTTAAQLTDGSGLSRDNRLTCTLLLEVLQRSSAVDPLGAGLARGGQEGTTLTDYFERDGLGGVIQGKTGSLTGVKSLGGYYVAAGEEVQYIVILNGAAADDFLTVWTDLGDALLAASAGPSADSLAPRS